MIWASACWVKDVYVDYVLRSFNIYVCWLLMYMYVCLRFLVCSTFRHVGWNINCLIKLQRSLLNYNLYWFCKVVIFAISAAHRIVPGADSRKGVPGVRPPPLKFSQIIGYSGVYNVYTCTQGQISRSVLVSQLFTCLSLTILFLSCWLCSVALISRGG